ncbi:MAG TPA: GNAT family N-acetyltransferase [Kofleriaceae bacterium]|nr:GNAT family N-acetyltransferase [Kofleriaceae bacterium]
MSSLARRSVAATASSTGSLTSPSCRFWPVRSTGQPHVPRPTAWPIAGGGARSTPAGSRVDDLPAQAGISRQGAVAGFAYASRHRERAAYQWSVDTSVYVRAGQRRAGVGRSLYRALLALLELQGFHAAHAGITLPNPGSVALHEAMGFAGHAGGRWMTASALGTGNAGGGQRRRAPWILHHGTARPAPGTTAERHDLERLEKARKLERQTRMTLRLLPALALTSGCITGGPRLVTSLPSVPAPSHVQVRIAADDASVRVASADITEVEVQVESRGYDVQRDLELSMIPHGGQIDIVAKTRNHLRILDLTSRSLHIDVRIPRDADLEVASGDGSVELDAVAGTVDVQTGDGSVAVRGARGSIRLHTGDGSIRGRDLDGLVDASTGDGSVKLEGRFDALRIATGDGSVAASAWPGSRMMQPWHLQTGDGSVSLRVPRDLAAHIDASTDDGSMHSTIPLLEVGSSHALGDVNGGGPPLVVRTGDGSIRLSQL